MRIGTVTGTVTATVKATGLTAKSLLLVDLIDAAGKVTEPTIVAVDTCGAGAGDTVLIASGSAARLSPETSGLCVDAAIVAVIDTIDVAAKPPRSKGKK